MAERNIGSKISPIVTKTNAKPSSKGNSASRLLKTYVPADATPQKIAANQADSIGAILSLTSQKRLSTAISTNCLGLRPQANRQISYRGSWQRPPCYANTSFTTFPNTSVSLKSRPWNWNVRRVWSIPKRYSIVACRSCTDTSPSRMLYE